MIRASHRPGLFSRDVLLNVYCKFRYMVSAQKVFDQMPERDAMSRNLLTACSSQIDCAGRGSSVSNEGMIENIVLDRFTYSSALSLCGDKGDVKTGRIIHGLVVVAGLQRRTFIVNALIDMYSKFLMIGQVRLVFDGTDELDEVSWNHLLSAYVRMGWPEVAVNILVWMHRAGVKLNCFALANILKACSDFDGDADDIRKMLHACVAKIGLDLDLFVGSAMLDMYARNDGLDEAIRIFNCIPNPSVVIFSTMVAGFSCLGVKSNDKIRLEALRCFSEMLRRRIRPSRSTMKNVIEACSSTNLVNYGRQLHAHVIKSDLQVDEFIGSALIFLYSKSGFVEASLRCFESTPKEETFTWTSMIAAYIQNEHFEMGLRLFKRSLGLGRKPDQFTLSVVMFACSNLGLLRTGEQIQGHAHKLGLNKFTVFGNSQVDMYTKAGDFDSSIKTFEEIGSLDIVSWSAMISNHALHGSAIGGVMLFEKIIKYRVKLDHLIFLAVLTACSHGGLVDDGFRYFRSMIYEYDLSPQAEHFACMVDLLGRAGRLIDAEGFISSSQFDNHPTLLHNLLQACLFNGNMEMAIRVGERLMTVDPLAAASYIALYKIYLDVGKISLAMRTRGIMRERGVKKEIDVSWIEIGPTVYSFTATGKAPPEIDKVYEKLLEVLSYIKQKGESGATLLELDPQNEKWKDTIMISHCELLTVTFGLLILPDFAVIRVFKNKRVCIDCHNLLKLFSEIYKQQIVLRDKTSFHHFSRGSCSCGEYW